MADPGSRSGYNLDLIEFLASKGRVRDAAPFLPDHNERDRDALRAVAAALREAGCHAEADEYDQRASDIWYQDYHNGA